MFKKLLVLLAAALLFPAAALADLSGEWTCDTGGRYYLSEVDGTLYWYGEQRPTHPAWANVYQGRIQGERVRGQWADVPKGRAHRVGTLQLQIRENGNVLVATRKTGGLDGTRWVRVGYTPEPPRPALREDCISFNLDNLRVVHVQGRWKVVDGRSWLFDFGDKEAEARQALRIIRHYRMNQSCFVGRPDPSFKYMLASGHAPAGSLRGEDCIGFDPDRIEVKQIKGRWKIVDGRSWLFDFGNKREEARETYSIIKKYGFNRTCFVGRPGPSFEYLRR